MLQQKHILLEIAVSIIEVKLGMQAFVTQLAQLEHMFFSDAEQLPQVGESKNQKEPIWLNKPKSTELSQTSM